MNWSDERYVKIYTRDTVNWRLLPWEAKALWLLLLRKIDGAGLLNTGKHDVNRAVAVMVELPVEVVAVGLPALIQSGSVEQLETSILVPNFIESQEATKTEAQRKRDQRQRHVDKVRAAQVHGVSTPPSHATSRGVTRGHEMSPSSPAHPPAQQTAPAFGGSGLASFQGLWNTKTAGKLSAWKVTSPKRAKTANARLAELPLDTWAEVIDRIVASPFCTGRNERGWRADVEFLLRPDTAAKVLEGRYDDRKGALNTRSPIDTTKIDYTKARGKEIEL